MRAGGPNKLFVNANDNYILFFSQCLWVFYVLVKGSFIAY